MNYSKKVLVTGATGLIGKETLKPLKDLGFQIYAISSQDHSSDKNVKWIKTNLFKEDEIKNTFAEIKPTHLLNLAWATTGDYLSSNINFEFVKVGLDLLKYFNENGGERAIFAGTCFEYKFKDTPLKETDEVTPLTAYSSCKNALRLLAESFCQQNGISFGYGRIFYVYGHGEDEKRLTPYIINNLKRNNEVIIKNGNLIRDYMYTKDIAEAFANFLNSNVNGCINICTEKGISLGDYATLIAKKLNKEDLLFIKQEATNQPPMIIGDSSRLIKEVGYTPQYNIKESLNEIIK